jgi:hypothetical protein
MLNTPLLNIISSFRVSMVLGLTLKLAFISSLSSFYENSLDVNIRVSSVYIPTIAKALIVIVVIKRQGSYIDITIFNFLV